MAVSCKLYPKLIPLSVESNLVFHTLDAYRKP
jgi:hypothetical protein